MGVSQLNAGIASRRTDTKSHMNMMSWHIKQLKQRVEARVADATRLVFMVRMHHGGGSRGTGIINARSPIQGSHGHALIHKLGHGHQGQPVSRRIHQVKHVHVHVHPGRRDIAGTAFAAI